MQRFLSDTHNEEQNFIDVLRQLCVCGVCVVTHRRRRIEQIFYFLFCRVLGRKNEIAYLRCSNKVQTMKNFGVAKCMFAGCGGGGGCGSDAPAFCNIVKSFTFFARAPFPSTIPCRSVLSGLKPCVSHRISANIRSNARRLFERIKRNLHTKLINLVINFPQRDAGVFSDQFPCFTERLLSSSILTVCDRFFLFLTIPLRVLFRHIVSP